jgi:hypothetical protein
MSQSTFSHQLQHKTLFFVAEVVTHTHISSFLFFLAESYLVFGSELDYLAEKIDLVLLKLLVLLFIQALLLFCSLIRNL